MPEIWIADAYDQIKQEEANGNSLYDEDFPFILSEESFDLLKISVTEEK